VSIFSICTVRWSRFSFSYSPFCPAYKPPPRRSRTLCLSTRTGRWLLLCQSSTWTRSV